MDAVLSTDAWAREAELSTEQELVLLLEEQERRRKTRKIESYYPDEDVLGPDGAVLWHARRKYPKHMEFFRAGAKYRERCFMAANRSGKSASGAYEMACHLTGSYPHWWEGRRFTHAVKAWAAGKTNETTRDILQEKLLGEVVGFGASKRLSGTGMIRGDTIGQIAWKQGVANLLDTVKVKHIPTGEWSTLGLKSYQQGRGSFEGTEQHVIFFDEEPDADVYGEALIRTATTQGIIYLTFTPLFGLTQTVLAFLPGGKIPKA